MGINFNDAEGIEPKLLEQAIEWRIKDEKNS